MHNVYVNSANPMNGYCEVYKLARVRKREIKKNKTPIFFSFAKERESNTHVLYIAIETEATKWRALNRFYHRILTTSHSR